MISANESKYPSSWEFPCGRHSKSWFLALPKNGQTFVDNFKSTGTCCLTSNLNCCFKPYLLKIRQAIIARITQINLFDIRHWTSVWQFRPITADEYHDSWETLWVSGFLLSKFHCFRAACQLLEEERKVDTPSLDRDAKKIVWCMILYKYYKPNSSMYHY